MTDDQFKELVEALKPSKDKEKNLVVDIVFKFSIPILVAVCGWMLSNNIDYGKGLVQYGEQMKNVVEDLKEMRSTIDKLEEFTAEPRFTQKNFEQQIKPVTDALLVITGELKDIKENERSMSLDIQRLQSDVEELKRKK